MANYANQKRYKITNTKPLFHEKNEPIGNGYYPPMYYDYIDKAATLLNGNAFKLWLYLIRWHNQGYVNFSPASVEQCMGLKKSSIQDSKAELEHKGFLIAQDDGTYLFTPISRTLV